MSANWKHKIVHDPLYGSFYLPQIAWTIIDTKIFQRLKKIKQTGNTHYVYPGVEHSRYQHCLGVAHLCEQMTRRLQQEYPQKVTNKNRLIICLAGLCHDLGHAAFSHLYDHYIIPLYSPDSDFTHEKASHMLLRIIYQENQDKFSESGITSTDIELIGQIIDGHGDHASHGHRTSHVQFMFDIVSNSRTGIDVDKFDYLARDAHFSGVPTKFDSTRLMEFAVLTGPNDSLEYESRAAKELIRAMWEARDDLHRRVYQHRVVKVVDLMIVEILKQSGDVPLLNKNDKIVLLRDAHTDMSTYIQLNDNLLDRIYSKTTPYARNLIDRLNERDLWKTLATIRSDRQLNFDLNQYGARVAVGAFRNEYVYHIVNTSASDLGSDFWMTLIKQASGGKITLRSSSNGDSSDPLDT